MIARSPFAAAALWRPPWRGVGRPLRPGNPDLSGLRVAVSIGSLGEYVRRICDDVEQRPVYGVGPQAGAGAIGTPAASSAASQVDHPAARHAALPDSAQPE